MKLLLFALAGAALVVAFDAQKPVAVEASPTALCCGQPFPDPPCPGCKVR